MRSAIKERIGQLMLTRVRRNGIDLSKLSIVPRSLRLPLQRFGLDPVPTLRRIRDVSPVTRLDRMFGIDIFLVTGHEQARAVLADRSSYSNDIRHLVGSDDDAPETKIGGLGFTDPPDHSRLRKILTPEFTRRRLRRLEPGIARVVTDQLSALERRGPVADLVSGFALPVPSLVICELLGLSEDQRERFVELAPARFDVSAGGMGTMDAASESRAFFFDVVKRQRRAPTEGMIGQIVREHGDELTDLDLVGLVDGVFLGGFETSASMLALGALTLLRDGYGTLARTGDADTVDRMVEELLRYLSVVQIAFPRFARHDLDLFGQQVRAGDVVVVSLSGSNRDGVLGEDMDLFDPYRHPTPHNAFGYGMHRCVGAELARMELRSAYPALFRRFPRMALAAPPSQLAFRKMSIVYGLESLPVRLW